MTRTIELPLPEELLRQVDERARTAGLPRKEYIRTVLLKDVSGEPSISAILEPLRDQVASSGISDEDLDNLFAGAREESRRERDSRTLDGR